MEPNNIAASVSPSTVKPGVPRGPLLFCVALMLVGCGYVGVAVWRYFHPPAGPDVAAAARALLTPAKSGPLEQRLAEAAEKHFPSYDHPLVGKPAPDFTRPDIDGVPWSLKRARAKGPVVVVFYYGYHCDHCVSQLFGLKEDYHLFRELGAEVVALSADTTDQTRAKYKEYGAFAFPVLWDRGNGVAEAYGVYTPPAGGAPEKLRHGTFVVGRDGVVTWAAFGETPFGDNDTLLFEVAKLTGRLKPN